MTKKLFILSSNAGSMKLDKFEKEIINCYKDNNRSKELEIIKTKDRDHAKKAILDFLKDLSSKKILYACGGDGSLNEISSILYNSDVALGLIPMGTANDFSKNFNYSNFKLENTFEPRISKIDMIEINELKALNIMSFGFDTKVLRKTYEILDKFPFLKNKAFILGVILSLPSVDDIKLDIELNLSNGKKISLTKNSMITALCNGAYFGNGFSPAPLAKIDDSILNLTLLEKAPLIEIFKLIYRSKNKLPFNSNYIKEFQVDSGIIKSDKEVYANVDGEIFKTDTFKFKILKKAILWADVSS
ncbi:MAG: diacylglycerol/lipid kinase family protein [Peptoniphilaceae bacterium]